MLWGSLFSMRRDVLTPSFPPLPSLPRMSLRPRLPVLPTSQIDTHAERVAVFERVFRFWALSGWGSFAQVNDGLTLNAFERRRRDCPATPIDASLLQRVYRTQNLCISPPHRPFLKTPPHLDPASSSLYAAKAEQPSKRVPHGRSR
jgi:hypothetical protein